MSVFNRLRSKLYVFSELNIWRWYVSFHESYCSDSKIFSRVWISLSTPYKTYRPPKFQKVIFGQSYSFSLFHVTFSILRKHKSFFNNKCSVIHYLSSKVKPYLDSFCTAPLKVCRLFINHGEKNHQYIKLYCYVHISRWRYVLSIAVHLRINDILSPRLIIIHVLSRGPYKNLPPKKP